MSSMLTQVIRGTAIGGGLGAGIMVVAGMLKGSVEAPVALYRQPGASTFKQLVTFSLEGDMPLTSLLARARQTIDVDVTCPEEASDQLDVTIYHLQRFFVRLLRFRQHTEVPSFGIALRAQGLRTLRSIKVLEDLCSSCREVETLLRITGEVREFVSSTTLTVEK